MKHIFIVNRISGKGQAYELIALISKIAQEKNIDYHIEVTQYAGHAQKLAEIYSKQKDIYLYSVGGDGTLSEVLNGISEGTPLAVIPAGSGNDFYRMIGQKLDYSKIISDTIDAPIRKVDIVMANKRRFINTTSIGLDADINAKASHLIRNTPVKKGAAYLFSILTNVIFLHPKKIRLYIDGEYRENNYLLVACMNGRYYGNGILASPNSNLQDGVFELCLYTGEKRRKAYPFLSKFLKGQHLGYKDFEIIKAKHVIIESDEEISCQSDGENYLSKRVELQILESWLLLKSPSYVGKL